MQKINIAETYLSKKRGQTSHAFNKGGGEDIKGQHGIARWTEDDNSYVITVFLPNKTIRWQLQISHDAPFAIFEIAWEKAQAQVIGNTSSNVTLWPKGQPPSGYAGQED